MRLSNRLTPSNPSNGADWAAESRASWRKMVMATPADFRFVIDVVPSEGDYNAVHLSHVGTARLFEETRIGYLFPDDCRGGVSWPDTAGMDLLPMVKEVLIRHQREALAGEPLRVGARPVARGRRSLVVEEALWAA